MDLVDQNVIQTEIENNVSLSDLGIGLGVVIGCLVLGGLIAIYYVYKKKQKVLKANNLTFGSGYKASSISRNLRSNNIQRESGEDDISILLLGRDGYQPSADEFEPPAAGVLVVKGNTTLPTTERGRNSVVWIDNDMVVNKAVLDQSSAYVDAYNPNLDQCSEMESGVNTDVLSTNSYEQSIPHSCQLTSLGNCEFCSEKASQCNLLIENSPESSSDAKDESIAEDNGVGLNSIIPSIQLEAETLPVSPSTIDLYQQKRESSPLPNSSLQQLPGETTMEDQCPPKPVRMVKVLGSPPLSDHLTPMIGKLKGQSLSSPYTPVYTLKNGVTTSEVADRPFRKILQLSNSTFYSAQAPKTDSGSCDGHRFKVSTVSQHDFDLQATQQNSPPPATPAPAMVTFGGNRADIIRNLVERFNSPCTITSEKAVEQNQEPIFLHEKDRQDGEPIVHSEDDKPIMRSEDDKLIIQSEDDSKWEENRWSADGASDDSQSLSHSKTAESNILMEPEIARDPDTTRRILAPFDMSRLDLTSIVRMQSPTKLATSQINMTGEGDIGSVTTKDRLPTVSNLSSDNLSGSQTDSANNSNVIEDDNNDTSASIKSLAKASADSRLLSNHLNATGDDVLVWDSTFEELKTKESTLKLILTPKPRPTRKLIIPSNTSTPLMKGGQSVMSSSSAEKSLFSSGISSSSSVSKVSKVSSNQSSLSWDNSCDLLEIAEEDNDDIVESINDFSVGDQDIDFDAIENEDCVINHLPSIALVEEPPAIVNEPILEETEEADSKSEKVELEKASVTEQQSDKHSIVIPVVNVDCEPAKLADPVILINDGNVGPSAEISPEPRGSLTGVANLAEMFNLKSQTRQKQLLAVNYTDHNSSSDSDISNLLAVPSRANSDSDNSGYVTAPEAHQSPGELN